MSHPTPEQLQFILESGILAPSADNHHWLRYEVDQEGVNVWYTAGALPLEGGYKRALVLLSLGAVSENLNIAARRYGYCATTSLFPKADKPDLIFRAVWELCTKDGEQLWEAIPKRHTNRNIRYRGPALSPEGRSRLERSTDELTGCGLAWLDEPRSRRQALRLMRRAEGERFYNRLLHKELFDAIRFDVGWRKSCNEGLPPGALAIERPLRLGFSLLRHWRVMQVVNLLGTYRLLAWRAADLPCRLAPHLAVITVDRIDDPAIFRAGRALQRVWLCITTMGMVLQPMPASVLYALENTQQEGIPESLSQCLRRGWQRLLPDQIPLMLFRIGRASHSSIFSGRKPLMYYLP